MQKQDYYVYPAIVNYDEPTIGIIFPDLPGCTSCADTTQEILRQAREALGLHISSIEDDGDEIPKPTDILKIKRSKNEAVVLVDVFMPLVRDAIDNKAITKSVTVPQWLNVAARAEDINFSQTLQDALMQKLGITREIKRRKNKANS